MQRRMVLVLPVAALFIACGAAPNGDPSRLTNPVTAATVNNGSFRIDGQPSGPGWTINAPIPQSQGESKGVAQGATVASADGSRIYHIGGITQALTATKKVSVYSPAADGWSDVADIPVTPGIRTFGAAVEVGGFIYVFGGFDGTNILDTTWIYDEVKNAWSEGANMPAPRFGSAVATDGSVIWVGGGAFGLSIGEDSHTIWRYEPSTDAWSFVADSPILMGRFRGVLLSDGNLHFLGGGFDGSTHVIFNTRTPSWYAAPQIPFGSTDAAIVSDGVRIYVAGGGGRSPRRARPTQIFDPVSRTWSLGPPMPVGVDNTSGSIANGTFYVMGGYDGTSPVSVNYSLPLSSLGAQDIVSSGSTDPYILGASDSRERRTDSQLAESSWSINWPIPEALGVAQGTTLASHDGSLIYQIGGWAGVYWSNRLRVYSPVDDTADASSMRSPWWDLAPVPVSDGIRSYGSGVEMNGFVYVFGGITERFSVLNTTWIYDETNDVWFRGANMPGFRFGPAVAADGAVIWVIGGYNQVGPDHTVWLYDPTADVYLTGFRDMPNDLGRIHGVWLPDGTIHVLGGNSPSLGSHLVYDTAVNAWSPAPPMPLPVLDPAVVTDGTLIYLAGAPDGPFPLEPGHTQIFNSASSTWSEGPRMPPPWGIDNTSGTIANGVFYVMGGSWGGGIFNSVNYSIPMSELSAFNR